MGDGEDSTPRAALYQTIQETLHSEEMPDGGGMLMGFVVVCEWMAPSGDRWLSRVSCDATGTKGAAPWQEQGYLHNALHDLGRATSQTTRISAPVSVRR